MRDLGEKQGDVRTADEEADGVGHRVSSGRQRSHKAPRMSMPVDLRTPIESRGDDEPTSLRRVPVNVVSASLGFDVTCEVRAKGAFDVVPKPFTLNSLANVVGQAMRLTEGRQT